jgi:hypothetical protein
VKEDSDSQLHYLSESKGEILELSEEQARALARVGKRLASTQKWWGDDEEEPGERTVIKCSPDSGAWRVRVRDAIGAVSAGGAQIVVQPKIPLDHLLYLFEKSGSVPRVDEQFVSLAKDEERFLEIVGQWFLNRLKGVLARGLVKDYRPLEEPLKSPKGRFLVGGTISSWYKGRFSFDCSYEEFDEDNPLNRVLSGACRTIVGARGVFSVETRKEAKRLLFEFPPISPFMLEDLRCRTDRRTAYYGESLTLARHILSGTGRDLEHGSSQMHSMLVKTPPLVEEGIRRMLATGLAPSHTVDKKQKSISEQHTLNPDLVFNDGSIVGDVKYKLLGESWSRSDLNQLATFAAGFRAPKGVLIGFSEGGHPLAKDLQVGNHHLRVVAWDVSGGLEPEQAAQQVVEEVRKFIEL